ncbi:MAG: glycosyltransferase [Oscillibacter sp.]|nr:glycosyltransferase [Oscillibacter sp.]
MTLAGVVTYNPDMARLELALRSVRSQVDEIIIADNHSSNADEISRLCAQMNISLLRNASNVGLAGALNQIFRASDNRYDWVLTMDQDSVFPPDYVQKAMRYADISEVGLICSGYRESNLKKTPSYGKSEPWQYVKRAITSGAVVRFAAYEAAGGYDELLFTDYVDFDFSIRLRQRGYRILRMNDTPFEHELGQSETKRFLFFRFRFTRHSLVREELIGKSMVIFMRLYLGKEPLWKDILSICKYFLLTLLYDDKRWAKIRVRLKGMRDGFKIPGESLRKQ